MIYYGNKKIANNNVHIQGDTITIENNAKMKVVNLISDLPSSGDDVLYAVKEDHNIYFWDENNSSSTVTRTLQVSGTTGTTPTFFEDGTSGYAVEVTRNIGPGRTNISVSPTYAFDYDSVSGNITITLTSTSSRKTVTTTVIYQEAVSTGGWNVFGPVAETINVLSNGAVVSSNAYYAEIGKWGSSVNPALDHVGKFVAIETENGEARIKLASSTDDVRGVVVTTPAFVAGYSDDKYNNGNLLPSYAYIGFAGQIGVKTDGSSINVGDRVMPNDEGVATKSSNNMGYQVIEVMNQYWIKAIIEPSADMIQRIKTDMSNKPSYDTTKGSGADTIVQLHPENNPNDNLYPNVIYDNVPKDIPLQASELGKYFVTEQDGYLNSNNRYDSPTQFKSKSTVRIACVENQVFMYKGIGRTLAYSVLMFNEYGDIVERLQYDSLKNYTEVAIPSGVTSVKFSSYAPISQDVVFDVYLKNSCYSELKNIDIRSLHNKKIIDFSFKENENLLAFSSKETNTFFNYGFQTTPIYNLYYNIKVEQGTTYEFDIEPRIIQITQDEISRGSTNQVQETFERVSSFTPLFNGYAQVSVYKTQDTDTIRMNKSDAINVGSKNHIVLLSDEIKSQITQGEVSQVKDILNGKKWVVIGDSFTYGDGVSKFNEGKYIGQNRVYPYLIAERTNIEIENFSGGGRTLAFPQNPGDFNNSITCPTANFYYQNIPVNADYITIYLGINDGHHSVGNSELDGEVTEGYIGLGTINDNTTSTYYGAWNVVLSWLRENRPFAHIGIIVSNGVNNNSWRMAQIEVAKKFGIPYIDMNGDDKTPVMIRSVNPDIDKSIRDTVTINQAVSYGVNHHPSEKTHEFESTFIENFLRSL